jgi:hypothetical protein
MRRLAAVRESQASFREEKRLAALTVPLHSAGMLVYRAPDHLEKRTTGPEVETIIVDGDRLTYTRPGEGVEHILVLSRAPELRGLVEAVRGTLAGDLAALQRFYSVGLEGTAEAWQLTLVPIDEALQGFLKVVRVKGSEARIAEVETVEPDGDVARMVIDTGT